MHLYLVCQSLIQPLAFSPLALCPLVPPPIHVRKQKANQESINYTLPLQARYLIDMVVQAPPLPLGNTSIHILAIIPRLPEVLALDYHRLPAPL